MLSVCVFSCACGFLFCLLSSILLSRTYPALLEGLFMLHVSAIWVSHVGVHHYYTGQLYFIIEIQNSNLQ